MKLIAVTIPIVCLLGLNACTEREVLSTESGWTTSEESNWGGAATTGETRIKKGMFGKVEPKKKRRMDQIFDEATDAQKMLSAQLANKEVEGDVKRPSFADQRFSSQNFEGSRRFSDSNKKNRLQSQPFLGKKDFGRKGYDPGNPARESGVLSQDHRNYSDMPSTYQTKTSKDAGSRYQTKTNENAGKLLPFFGSGRNARESNAVVIQPRGMFSPNAPERAASMSVDEVRKMLHPNEYAEES